MAEVHQAASSTAVDFVSAYATAAAELVEAIPSCDMAARVPACPGWSTYDLLVHVGNVHAWAATIVETGREAPEQDDRPGSRRAKSVARWYSGKAEDLFQVLRAAQPGDPCWTFSAGHSTKAFWPRRQTHETLVHLADLRQAAGRTADIPAPLAADGVAEVLEVFLPRMHARGRPARLDAQVLLHAHDTGDAWLLTPFRGEGPPLVRRIGLSGGPDSHVQDLDRVSAPAADLMLLLWKRLPVDHPGLTLDGDRDHILAFLTSPLTP